MFLNARSFNVCMEKFEFLQHTADAMFRAYGDSIEEKFSNAALAMFSIMIDTETVDAKTEKQVEAEGDDLKSLLYRWLEELLFLLDTEFFILNSVKHLKIEKK